MMAKHMSSDGRLPALCPRWQWRPTKRMVAVCSGLAILVLFGVGCAHKIPVTQPGDASATESAVIWPVDLKTSNARGNASCYVDLENIERKRFQTEIKAGKQNALLPLPPGIYTFVKFHCTRTDWYVSEQRWTAFVVYPGKISLLSPTEVIIDDEIRMTVAHLQGRVMIGRAREAWDALSPVNQKRLRSGYSETDLDYEMLLTSGNRGKREITFYGGKVDNPKQDFPEFDDCYQAEQETNPLAFGYLSVRAKIENKRFVNLQVDRSTSTYSARFADCVQAKFKDRKFERKNAYEVYLTL